MVLAMDEAVRDKTLVRLTHFSYFPQIGVVTSALVEAGMADNTLIVFTADNGGQTLR